MWRAGGVRSAWGSDTGKVRENNEDSVLVDEARGLFLLADGMGGHRAGETASSLAVQTAHRWLIEHLPPETAEAEVAVIISGAALEAHRAILADAESDPEHAGMGTTLELLAIRAGWAFISHAGDSRIYHMRETLRQITRDHNMAGRLHAQGLPDEMINPYFRHVLTQALGSLEGVQPDTEILALQPGDLLLLCSDGLTEMLGNGEIEEILRRRRDLPAAVNDLIAAANGAGGGDNVSVVLVEA